nr:uncharacterized protein LOC109189816 [Ipomoea batatas]
MYTKRTQGEKAMPFVGLYAAAASTICSIAMLLNSMYKQLSFYKHTKTFHFSSKYFALNATWLTLLAVATKLTGDLTTQMHSPRDNLTKISSTAFLTMAMGNFFTTLASMTDKDILINVTALGILVTTVLVNLCIQLSTHVLEFSLFPKILFIMVLLVCTFITIVCSALAVPAIKKRSESKYQTIHNNIQLLEGQQHTVEEMRLSITKYWVMAASASPQFMMTSFSFDGVREFDSNRVSSLLYDELSNCWALPIVTLTSIAITLPNIESQHVDWLVSSVDEGLHYVRLIDALDEKHYLKGIKSAADVVWVGVELHKKWLDAERIVMEFWCEENPLYWPANVLAANSMYRVSNTILLCYENDECRPEEVFRKLICMIADILAACLTNLSHLIVTKCSCNAIEQREKNVREAAILVGETENILKHFKERQLTSIGPDHPLYIDDWRRWMERRIPNISTSATHNGALSTVPYP